MAINQQEDTCGEKLQLLEAIKKGTVEKAAAIFRTLGDAERLQLLIDLSKGEASVSTLAKGSKLSTVSQRLKTLKAENLVISRREGKQIIYRIADNHVLNLITNALEHAEEL